MVARQNPWARVLVEGVVIVASTRVRPLFEHGAKKTGPSPAEEA